MLAGRTLLCLPGLPGRCADLLKVLLQELPLHTMPHPHRERKRARGEAWRGYMARSMSTTLSCVSGVADTITLLGLPAAATSLGRQVGSAPTRSARGAPSRHYDGVRSSSRTWVVEEDV